MADNVDRGNELNELFLNDNLKKIPRYFGVSATHCEDCGDRIPDKRREVLPGIKTCVPCAERRGL